MFRFVTIKLFYILNIKIRLVAITNEINLVREFIIPPYIST